MAAGGKPPPLESCEGDEYVITITFLGEESTLEDAPVDIVLKQLNEDGTTDELQLEGDLGDAHALASTLEGEGNCVKVEIAQPATEGAEEEAEEPGSSEEVAEPGEVPVPASP